MQSLSRLLCRTSLLEVHGGHILPRLGGLHSRRWMLGAQALSTNGASPETYTPQAWPPLPREKLDPWLSPPGPPAPSEQLPAWADEVWASPLDQRRHIFCNRSLNMKSIKAIGFDMDYTLAQYRPETFETLAYTETVKKLVEFFGYPEVIRDFKFDWRYMVRGLTIDKKRGNILKIDRHKYVKLAYHGFRQLSRAERLATYSNAEERHEYDEPDYALIDTLFSLAEAHLFMQLVELQDAQPHLLPPGKQTADLYKDVRASVDLCHRDGSLKQAVAQDPAKYIHEDLRLAGLLETLRQSGRKLFVATNSLWDYTNVVMNYLLCGRVGNDRNLDWLEHFDVVITGCGKPAFFTGRKPIFEVQTSTGMLRNTDGGTPMVAIGEQDLPKDYGPSRAPEGLGEHAQGEQARVFQGGVYLDLHKMLGVRSGSEVLYIGDHIYGDILRSKKTLGWRTMLVVPELESELAVLQQNKDTMRELAALRQSRDVLDDQIHRCEWRLRFGRPAGSDSDDEAELGGEAGAERRAEERRDGGAGGAGREADDDEDLQYFVEGLANLKQQRDEVREKHRSLLKAHHERFHRVWGQILKTGYQNSRFAHQVERFACLYTSHVSNLDFYSPDKSYRARMDHMAHEEEPVFDDNFNCDVPPTRQLSDTAKHR
ncbi:hypothetical protein WJX72_007769 [[Myrmecia] bisecta]|uniref:5'-nucleotidase domain-containing protein 4 n=1 Tax=[Myrmecia] bisecta TaxID=41462 RepID=A0AAW1R821_9CHLO